MVKNCEATPWPWREHHQFLNQFKFPQSLVFIRKLKLRLPDIFPKIVLLRSMTFTSTVSNLDNIVIPPVSLDKSHSGELNTKTIPTSSAITRDSPPHTIAATPRIQVPLVPRIQHDTSRPHPFTSNTRCMPRLSPGRLSADLDIAGHVHSSCDSLSFTGLFHRDEPVYMAWRGKLHAFGGSSEIAGWWVVSGEVALNWGQGYAGPSDHLLDTF